MLNGLSPLADFNAQYASLMPYLIALPMRAFEPTMLVFTITLCALSLLALLSVYGVLRRASGSPMAAFVLFVPFMATSLFFIAGIPQIRFTPGVYFPMFPLRYGGAYFLAWLVARHLERERTVVWPLFLAAGLAVLNNFEFGVAALGATGGALLATIGRPSRRRVLRLLGAAAAGVAGAVVLYSVVTLLRAGSLPHLWRLAQFARLYGAAGYSVAPLPAPSAFRSSSTPPTRRRSASRPSARSARSPTVCSPGCGVGGPVRARVGELLHRALQRGCSDAVLRVGARARAARDRGAAARWRRPARVPNLAGLAVLFGFGLTVCSLAQAPSPWQQIERVRERPANLAVMSSSGAAQQDLDGGFVGSLADGPRRFVFKRGAPVAIFTTMGHRLADSYGVVDVVPYTGPESIHTQEQLDEDARRVVRRGWEHGARVAPIRRAAARPAAGAASRS